MGVTRTKEWIKYLPDGFRIYHRLNTLLGKVVSFSVALLNDGECVTRADMAHGFAHRDVIGRKSGTLHKEPYINLTPEEVFNYADQDFSENYAEYNAYYESH